MVVMGQPVTLDRLAFLRWRRSAVYLGWAGEKRDGSEDFAVWSFARSSWAALYRAGIAQNPEERRQKK